MQKEVEQLDFDDGNHAEVLKALSKALMKTEETFMDCADMMASENPELALMGSCVLVMLMKGEDVYLMNVGDSRAVLATKGKMSSEFEMDGLLDLAALQLTLDHCTSVDEVNMSSHAYCYCFAEFGVCVNDTCVLCYDSGSC